MAKCRTCVMHGDQHETGCPIADIQTELAEARKLLVDLIPWISVPRDEEHPLRLILSRTRAFLEATDGSADRG